MIIIFWVAFFCSGDNRSVAIGTAKSRSPHEITRQKTRTVAVIEGSYFSVASLICDAALRKLASQLLTAGHPSWVSAFDPILECRMRVILIVSSLGSVRTSP